MINVPVWATIKVKYFDTGGFFMNLVYVFCADGFEEVEGLTAVDLLRRAEFEVKTVPIMGQTQVTGSHHILSSTAVFNYFEK